MDIFPRCNLTAVSVEQRYDGWHLLAMLADTCRARGKWPKPQMIRGRITDVTKAVQAEVGRIAREPHIADNNAQDAIVQVLQIAKVRASCEGLQQLEWIQM